MHKNTRKILAELPSGGFRSYIGRKFFRKDDGALLRENVEQVSRKRSAFIKDAYAGATAYIMSCGPSMEMVWNEDVKNFLEDKLVIAVKQAQRLAPEIVDIHLYNEVRMEGYVYHENTIRISCSQFMADHPSHIHYPIRQYHWEDAVMVTDDYDRWSIDKSFERPWGVGIMFELGLFLPAHLGCRRAVIMGFDMNSKGKYHFYDGENISDSQFYGVDKEEFYYAQRTVPHYLRWAKCRDLEIRLYSPLSVLSFEKIENIYSY